VSLIPRITSVFGAILVVLAAAAPVAAGSSATVVIETLRAPGSAAATGVSDVGISPPPCSDAAYNLFGARQASTYEWSFKKSSTPAGLSRSGVAEILQKSFGNITGEHNDCGRADHVSATSQYVGTTSRAPNCSSRDGHNVVGFSSLPSGVLAVTCYWIKGGKIVEADMRITTRESWALSMATCHGDMPLLESTITHEAGHVFGLDHVGERRHGRLTMSPFLDGPCNNNEATLGLGDMLGLEALY
jgi:hypothetical protein